MPRSWASSAVSSIGNPSVSWRKKTSSGVRAPRSIRPSSRSIPWRSAIAKRSSSAWMVSAIRWTRVASSGYTPPRVSATAGTADDRWRRADTAGVHHRAPDQAAQHVAAALVGRTHAVRQQHRAAAGVVGENANGSIRFRRAGVPLTRFGHPVLDEGTKEIGLEDPGAGAVRHGGDALQAHPGVDPFALQWGPGSGLVAVPLHEDEVPDLEEAVAVLTVRPAVGPPAAVFLAPVIVDLRVRPAGPRRSGRPEVVVIAKAPDPLGRDAGRRRPDVVAFVVVVVDPGPEPPGVNLELLGEELVSKRDGLLLEVVAKGEVAEHLEEGQVMAVVPDHLDVHRPKHLLGRGCAGMGRPGLTEKVGFEGHHPGAGEQQARIAERDQGGARQHLVVPLFEEVEKTVADLGAGHIWLRALIVTTLADR